MHFCSYMYPRHLLTSHFWSLQQRVEFQELFLKERTLYNKRIFRKLQENLDATNQKLNYVLGLLGSGTHPTSDEILSVQDVFTDAPYRINSLSSSHLVSSSQ
jgi:LETM1-like protein